LSPYSQMENAAAQTATPIGVGSHTAGFSAARSAHRETSAERLLRRSSSRTG
jgi:hypothetical protein